MNNDSPDLLRAACIQTNSGNDMEANAAAIFALMEDASSQGAGLIALPENAFLMRASETQIPPLYDDITAHPGVQLCTEFARKRRVWILIGSLFAKSPDHSDRWYNRSLLINAEGHLVASYDKIHLFDVTLDSEQAYRESKHILPGQQMVVAPTPWGNLGLSICYDVRFPHMYRDMAKAGASLLAVPAAFTETTGIAHWHVLLRARAIESGCYLLAPAQCGEHPGGRRTYGHSLIISPWGEILAEGNAIQPGVVMAELDLTRTSQIRTALPSLQHDRKYTPATNLNKQ